MDKLILKSKDVETRLQWRDNNKELVRQMVCPLPSIQIVFPETGWAYKAFRKDDSLVFQVSLNGRSQGKLAGQVLPNGNFLPTVNKLQSPVKENIQSILTVYSSVMAYLSQVKSGAVTCRDDTNPVCNRSSQHDTSIYTDQKRKQSPNDHIIYFGDVVHTSTHTTRVSHHRSPQGAFSVRGHWRHYPNGKIVWINSYHKGTGKQKAKTYKFRNQG